MQDFEFTGAEPGQTVVGGRGAHGRVDDGGIYDRVPRSDPVGDGEPLGRAALAGDASTFTTTYHFAHATYLKIVAAAKKAGLPASSPCHKVF